MLLTQALKSEGIVFKENEPMSCHTSFKTGGSADVFILPTGVDMLSKALKLCAEFKLNPLVVGNGSNLLIPDSGLRRPVILMTEGFSSIEVKDTVIHCSAGVPLVRLCRFALDNALTGLEFAYGIPGSAGGAVCMNAGAYGGEMKDVLLSCSHLDKNGVSGSLYGSDLDLSYRKSAYSTNGCAVTSLTVGLRSSSRSEIKEKMDELMARRKDKQPLEYPSAGSVFKRPEGYFAGALIEQSGLKGKTIGGAQVSVKHAGFIVNIGGATTKDVTDLIEFCRETVYKNTGVMLEPEIKTAQDI